MKPELTPFEASKYQRERDIISYLAETIELLGGDNGPGLDTAANWLYRLRKKALKVTDEPENPITTSSWKDKREEVKRWCDG